MLLQLGQIGAWLGDGAQARPHLEASLALARELEHRESEAECELVIGELEFDTGTSGQARDRFMRSLAISREAADKRGEANALWWLAKVDLGDRALAAAAARLDEALRAFRAFEMRNELLGCLEDCAVLASVVARNDLAVQIAAAAAASRERLSLIRPPRSEVRWQEHVADTARSDWRRVVPGRMGAGAPDGDRRGDPNGPARVRGTVLVRPAPGVPCLDRIAMQIEPRRMILEDLQLHRLRNHLGLRGGLHVFRPARLRALGLGC